jgi:NAD(P)H-flavin reductase
MTVPRPLRIARRLDELRDVFTFVCDAPSGFAFQPGQFNMVYAHGAGEVPISISGDPAAPRELVHTIRAVGAVTRALGRLAAGDLLAVRGPYGKPWPLDELGDRDVLVVAGGLGLAPLRPAIRQILAERARFGRVTIAYGARSPDDLLFAEELARWRGRFDVTVGVTVDRADRSWRGPVGVVTRLVAGLPVDRDDAVLLCGPEPMMRFVIADLAARGVPEASIWLSLERSMKCGVGLCGHCQLGGSFVCKDGPVYRLDRIAPQLAAREL